MGVCAVVLARKREKARLVTVPGAFANGGAKAALVSSFSAPEGIECVDEFLAFVPAEKPRGRGVPNGPVCTSVVSNITCVRLGRLRVQRALIDFVRARHPSCAWYAGALGSGPRSLRGVAAEGGVVHAYVGDQLVAFVAGMR